MPLSSTLTLGTASTSSSRRKLGATTRGWRVHDNDTTEEDPSSRNEALPQIRSLFLNVIGTMNKETRHHLEREKKQGKEQQKKRLLTRTRSAQQEHRTECRKRQPLSRHLSEELLDSTNISARSHLSDRLEDTEWVSFESKAAQGLSNGTRQGAIDAAGFHRTTLSMKPPDHVSLTSHEASIKNTKALVAPAVHAVRPDSLTTRGSTAMRPPPDLIPSSHRQSLCHTRATGGPSNATPPPQDPHSKVLMGRSSAPVGSQSTRLPPPLGMRRTNAHANIGTTAMLPSSQSLPTKQRGFKTPFVRHPAGSSQTSSTSSCSTELHTSSGSVYTHPTISSSDVWKI